MIEAEPGFFGMRVEGSYSHAFELDQSSFLCS